MTSPGFSRSYLGISAVHGCARQSARSHSSAEVERDREKYGRKFMQSESFCRELQDNDKKGRTGSCVGYREV